MNCSKCGKQTSKLILGMCQGCWKYFHDGGLEHPLPQAGKIEYDSEGKVICHICGRSFTRLGSHAKESHGMTASEYKEKFGLCARAKTTEGCYSKRMNGLAYKYEMPKQLIETGKGTRIQKGDNSMRKGKRVRLQEILDKRNRRK